MRVSSGVSGTPYQLTAETLDPCQISFIKRDDFVQFMKEHSDVCLRVAEELSNKYHSACRELRSHGLSHSAEEKLAKLLLEWSTRNGESSKAEPRVTLEMTHEEIAQRIGISRETATRLLARMKERKIAQFRG